MNVINKVNISDAQEFLAWINEIMEKYAMLGPLPGLLTTYIEAFFPFLPLFVFVMANSAAYGLFKGFFYSWIGSSLGSITVFLIVRKFKDEKFLNKISNNRQVLQVTSWVDRRGFGPLFVLLCFPFSPSSLINIVAGLAQVSRQQFMLAVFLGKAVMIFSIAYVGTSIFEFAKNPTKTIVIVVCILLFWTVGKILEKKYLNSAKKNKRRGDD